ncbi:MAG: NodT protein [Desulfobacterales bacterium]|nr:MAG: NodT protein [Desulfobacterales bacterium]
MIRQLCAGGWMLLMISGCTALTPESAPSLPVVVPESYANQPFNDLGAAMATPITHWWTVLGSRELNAMVQKGLANNYDLKIRRARIAQSAAVLKKVTAARLPGLAFSIGGTRTHTRSDMKGSSPSDNSSHSWNGNLSASYTPDIWGNTAASVRAADMALDAARQDYNETALALTTDIAERWVNLISVRERLKLLHSQIRVDTAELALQNLRFLNGKASALDVSQQRESLAKSLSGVPLLEKEEKQEMNALALLMGGTPGQPIALDTTTFPNMTHTTSPGIPAALLAHRPDIRAARLRLMAAREDVAAAKADLLPAFTLTASALFSSGSLDLLFQNWVSTLAGSFAGPILDGGRRRAEVERTRAVVQERLNTYAKTVATAIGEVEDSLVGIDRQAEYIQRLEEELAAAGISLKNSRVQYLNGQGSYLNYLTAWSAIKRLERQLVNERANLIKKRIALHNAMGWQAAEAIGVDDNV